MRRAARENPLSYLDAKSMSSLVGQSGTIFLSTPGEFPFTESFAGVPNYVGDAVPGAHASLTFATKIPHNARLELTIAGKGGCQGEGNSLTVNGARHPIPSGTFAVNVPSGNLTVGLETADDVCYIVLSKMKATLATSPP